MSQHSRRAFNFPDLPKEMQVRLLKCIHPKEILNMRLVSKTCLDLIMFCCQDQIKLRIEVDEDGSHPTKVSQLYNNIIVKIYQNMPDGLIIPGHLNVESITFESEFLDSTNCGRIMEIIAGCKSLKSLTLLLEFDDEECDRIDGIGKRHQETYSNIFSQLENLKVDSKFSPYPFFYLENTSPKKIVRISIADLYGSHVSCSEKFKLLENTIISCSSTLRSLELKFGQELHKCFLSFLGRIIGEPSFLDLSEFSYTVPRGVSLSPEESDLLLSFARSFEKFELKLPLISPPLERSSPKETERDINDFLAALDDEAVQYGQ